MAVDAAPGACFIDEEEKTHGEHGFGLSCPQARTLLWLCGPGIRRAERLAEAELIDIAPTLAKALGLSLEGAQGRVLKEAFS